MKKIAALAGVAALALGAGSAQARHGADDPAGHQRHGADDATPHAKLQAKHHRARHARHGHGADDGPNHT